MTLVRRLQMAASLSSGGGGADMIVEFVSSGFYPSFSGSSFSQTVNTGTTTYSGYTRYVLIAFGNLNASSFRSDWDGNTPTLGGNSLTVLASLLTSTSYRFGYVWSIIETTSTGNLTYAHTLNASSAGAGIFVFNVFARDGTPTLHDSDVAQGADGSITLSVPSSPNALFMAAIPQNDSVDLGGTAGIVNADKVASGDVNSGEIATAAFKEDVTSGGVTTQGGSSTSVTTGIMLNLT
jgi:hypothetical protein